MRSMMRSMSHRCVTTEKSSQITGPWQADKHDAHVLNTFKERMRTNFFISYDLGHGEKRGFCYDFVSSPVMAVYPVVADLEASLPDCHVAVCDLDHVATPAVLVAQARGVCLEVGFLSPREFFDRRLVVPPAVSEALSVFFVLCVPSLSSRPKIKKWISSFFIPFNLVIASFFQLNIEPPIEYVVRQRLKV